jgi:membrane-bound lytic murein transglycosylase B
LNFDLNQWLSSIDLSTAVDGNGDGSIEINPNDPDGNNNLANQLNEDLEGSCEIDD